MKQDLIAFRKGLRRIDEGGLIESSLMTSMVS